MSSQTTSLSPGSDPTSLAKIQILLIPIHLSSPSSPTLSEATYVHWTTLIKRHQSIRREDVGVPKALALYSSSSSRTAAPRARFFPTLSGGPIPNPPSHNHVHLAYPSQPPPRHLYPLSLLRMASFPLVIIGIAAEPEEQTEPVKGYSVDERDSEDTGDLGQASSSDAPAIEGDPVSDALANAMQSLFPATSPFPLVRKLILVPPHITKNSSPPSSLGTARDGVTPRKDGDGTKAEKSQIGEGLVLHAPTEGTERWIGRMLGGILGELMAELGDLVSRESLPDLGPRTSDSYLANVAFDRLQLSKLPSD